MPDQISGYAALFGDVTEIGGEFQECLAVGCFDRTLRENPEILMLLDHDYGRVLGRTTAGTLTLRADSTGLHYVLDVDASTPEGQTALGTVRRRDIKGCSFGFRVKSEEWFQTEDDLPLRVIKDVELHEVTLTAIPAYEGTTATLRSAPTAKAAVNPSTKRVVAGNSAKSSGRDSVAYRRALMEQKIRGIR